MKKISIIILAIFAMTFFTYSTVFATQEKNILETNTTSEIIEIKEETKTEMQEYVEKYGSESYGLAAFILNKVRLYSIPFCFIGIAIGALQKYIIGIRRLDSKQTGYGLIIACLTILVICQVLPLIFTIVVRGWRG